MKTVYLVSLILMVGCSQSGEMVLKPFNSDGCSLFPEKSLIANQDWCECCFEHDLRYWKGGKEEERLLADLELRECILSKTGDENLAELMYQGVRFGGSPYFYNWYRWGYGWNYDRKYGALSEKELEMVAQKMREYYQSGQAGPCAPKKDSQQAAEDDARPERGVSR